MENRIFARAKINLMLHVTGRRADGYHTLNTLIGFTDIADEISFKTAEIYGLQVDGLFASHAPASDQNLVTHAVKIMERAANKRANMEFTLTKNIPAGAGLGGGSADAAAVMHVLNDAWGKPFSLQKLQAIGVQLGAELPVCLAGTAQWVGGIGDKMTPATMPVFYAVVIWPGKVLSTADVFRIRTGAFTAMMDVPSDIASCKNDLTDAAITLQPVIRSVLNALEQHPDCMWARMSGSGSACFGVFADQLGAKKAAAKMAADHPGWWVKDSVINP